MPHLPRLRLVVLVLALATPTIGRAQSASRGAVAPPDDRFKADLLLIVGHPDDDVVAGTYLAKLVFDESKRVAVVFGTPGDSGGNEIGPERAASLGLVRQVEARRDLATLGISNVWFLNGHDTPGQDPVRSLASWRHGAALADAVRLIRLTRPAVVLTWLPMQVAGENHGDHQAAAVLATEAFDLAGDPTVFPEQLASPTEQYEPRLEGLRPWQPQKLYFMSDAIDTRFMEGHGPSYPVTAVSASKGVKYWELAYGQLQAHLTQYRKELAALAAADPATRERMVIQAPPGDALIDPLRFIRGKSLVGGTPTGDVFERVSGAPVAFTQPPGYKASSTIGITLDLGGPWRFYRQFWQAHGLEALDGIDLHDIGPIGGDANVRIPLVVANATRKDEEISVTAVLPEGWHEQPRPTSVLVPAGGEVELSSRVTGVARTTGEAMKVTYQAHAGTSSSNSLVVNLVALPAPNPLPR